MKHVREVSRVRMPATATCEGPTIKDCISGLLNGEPADSILFGCIPAALERKKCESGG